MCGLLTAMRFDGADLDRESVARMRDTMRHRGPDDEGLFYGGNVALAHRRLAIIDLSEQGRQPLTNEDGSVVLVFNGEVYNYLELRNDLKSRGHQFVSTSDSEVIVHQYEENGEECLQKFVGMFAFVLYDKKNRKLFAARDRIGIKPLYYYVDEKMAIFASEIKAILESPGVQRLPDYEAISDYMFAGRSLGGRTLFKNIREVPPGYLATVDQSEKRLLVRKYWDVQFDYNYERTDSQLQETLQALLDEAVNMHCRSDAPLGCHLSGGLDSSTIAALAARHYKPLKTFSIKFSDDPYIDETRYAKAVARHIGAEYYESSPSAQDLGALLPSLMWHMDMPMATNGGFSYYTVSRLARESVKVTLTGHGGDELFGGYPAQFQAAFGKTDMFPVFRDPNQVKGPSSWSKLITLLSGGDLTSLPARLYARMFPKELSLEDLWMKYHCGYAPLKGSVFHGDFLKELGGYQPRDEYLRPLREATTQATFDKCLYHDLRVYLPGLLHLEDRVSMALSVESRVPFLDHRIVELLATVPPELKVPGLQPKYLLRRVAASLLPSEVSTRKDKFPFPVPAKFLSAQEVKAVTGALLTSADSLGRGIFTRQALRDASSNKVNAWPFINLELWFKIFIDRDPNWTERVHRL